MAADGRPRLRLRALTLASASLLLVLLVALAAALTWASRVTWNATQITERETRAIVLAAEIDRSLREYNRFANLLLASPSPEIEAERRSIVVSLDRLLLRMQEAVQGEAETRLLAALVQDIDMYFAEREALHAQGRPLDQVTVAIRPFFERTLVSSAQLLDQTESNLSRTQDQAARLLRLEASLLVAFTLLLIGAFIAVAVAMRAWVVSPLLDLQGAMRRFRGGETGARARGGRLAETWELARAFNEMTDTIARQRRDQLTFLASVAHDLRNPLSVLKTSIHVLEHNQALATPERLQVLGDQINLLARMVNDLLDATRIEAGELDVQLEALDLRKAARTVVELWRETTRIHEIVLNAPPQPLLVRADSLRIEQVISNLLTNAIKYSPTGGCIQVSLEAVDGAAQLSVADPGVGIPAEEIKDLFLPFRRHPSTAEMAPGVGLGLSIARRILHAHGGRIDVESTPGVGSIFRIRLPLARAADISAPCAETSRRS